MQVLSPGIEATYPTLQKALPTIRRGGFWAREGASGDRAFMLGPGCADNERGNQAEFRALPDRSAPQAVLRREPTWNAL